MHIAWVNLTGGGMSGGYRKYLYEVLPRIVRDPRVTRLDIVSPKDMLPEDIQSVASSHSEWANGDKWQGFRQARAILTRLRPDLVYIPTARWVDSGGAPTVVMVRNMEPLVPLAYRNPMLERVVNIGRRSAARRACQKAQRIIAVSEFVRGFLVERWATAPQKVARVYHGVGGSDSHAVAKVPQALSARKGGALDFLFIAGSLRPMRGVEDGILALARLTDAFPALHLAVAGAAEGRVAGWEESVRQLISSHDLEKRVIWLGKLRPEEMKWAFTNCRAFLMTSRVEACPNTALEAMLNGAPTISTRNPPMPEFFGEGALYYTAGSDDELAEQITRLLRLPAATLANLTSGGRQKAASYTWDDCAENTLNVLAATANEHPAVAAS